MHTMGGHFFLSNEQRESKKNSGVFMFADYVKWDPFRLIPNPRSEFEPKVNKNQFFKFVFDLCFSRFWVRDSKLVEVVVIFERLFFEAKVFEKRK